MVGFAQASRIIANQCACVRVRRASRALTRLYDERLRAAGLQASQLTMLAAVATCGDGGANIGALAEGLVMDRTTLTRNLEHLVIGPSTIRTFTDLDYMARKLLPAVSNSMKHFLFIPGPDMGMASPQGPEEHQAIDRSEPPPSSTARTGR